MSENRPFVFCEDLIKIYKVGELEVMALQGLNLQIEKGELMSIIGTSGSGKSTLLNTLGGLDFPTAGKALVGTWDLLRLNAAKRAKYRRQMVGFVWQNPSRNLIPYLSALENVEMPMILAGKPNRKRAKDLLSAVGLGQRMKHRPLDMSGGEQQRVAIAIALANQPELVLADEPTGALDSRTGAAVLDVFRQVRDEFQVTVIIVTHDPGMARSVDRYVEIRDGKTSTEVVRRSADTPTGKEEAREAYEKASEGRLPGAGVAVDEESHEAFALLDSAGRVQLPKEFLDELQGRRVKLALEDGRVVIQGPDSSAEAG